MIHTLTPYPAYRNSGVSWLGEVPAHWEVKRLKQCAERFYAGGTPDSGNAEYYCNPPEGLPWLVIADMTKQKYVKKTIKAITEKGRASKNLEALSEGTILYSIYASLGTVSILEIKAAVNQAIIGIKFRKSDLETKFAFHYLENLRPHLALMSNSNTQANLNAEKVRSLPLFLPPLPEQSAIVRYLDYMDRRIRRYIHAKQKLIKLLEEQKQAIIHRAVTRGLDPDVRLKDSGVEWLGEVPEHWDIWQIGHFAKVGNGSTPSRGSLDYWKNGTYPWLNSSYANQKSVTQADQFVTDVALKECHLPKVPIGSILVAITGQGKTRGKATILHIDATINQHLAYITPKNILISPDYLQLALEGAYLQLRAISDDSGSTKGALTCSDLKHFRIALPSLSEQERILYSVQNMNLALNNSINTTLQEIALLREYRTRLISDVVTGKLDVREAAANLPEEIGDIEIIEDEAEESGDEDLEEMTEEE